MNIALRWVTAFLAFAITQAGADTITTKEHISVNGSLKRLAKEGLIVMARYPSADKTLSIPIQDIEIIEFNSITFNAGGPRRDPGLGAPLGSKSSVPAAPAKNHDTIVLRGGQRRACKLVGIDEQEVHCAGRDGDYSRSITIRIVLASR
jgi:hypothetical protein